MSFVKVENLRMDLGEFEMHINELHLKKGEHLIIIGPSGSGKSIFLETIMGFYTPDAGSIYINDEEITTKPVEERNISIIYQDHCLFPHMNVFENIVYGLKKRTEISEDHIKEEVVKVSKMLKIDHLLYRDPITLSGGELQRVSIARAIIVKPKVLLMDEPFSSLDQKTKASIRKIIRDLREQFNMTIIHVSHDLDDIWWLSSKVAVMDKGKILQIGTKEEVINQPAKVVADFFGINILEGVVEGYKDGLTYVRVGSYIFKTVDEGEGRVTLSIRPENIVVADRNSPFISSAQNKFTASVEDIVELSKIAYITFKLGELLLNCVITINSLHEMGIKRGAEVLILIKAINIKIID
ncbi:MAG TPA: ATP-binding cassette domain-containing protein [Methanothermobacter sp.]|nr:anion permease [Methanothermobacter sp. MT-2]BAW31492.1 anion permease [Methanothermobacter sp. MT-2]HOK72788.1 ATP-binding cassette domain-containing protein [Methanothermobacter sp.]HOL69676.1 ATP-binding cassette domain-containing protein [Methanothermobacter sp.]HPQ05252.1 ATP-binding cassette domain-containing protein [Methanothermobacter sp.]